MDRSIALLDLANTSLTVADVWDPQEHPPEDGRWGIVSRAACASPSPYMAWNGRVWLVWPSGLAHRTSVLYPSMEHEL